MPTFSSDENRRERNAENPGSLMWREFVQNTTLHGLRYVFLRGRPKLLRALWLLLIMAAACFYLSIVYGAVSKFIARPMSTSIRTEYVDELEFPAVTICPLNKLSRRKVTIPDHDPAFNQQGLNMTECRVTAAVRNGRTCGVALLCCCTALDYLNTSLIFPECTEEYKDRLLSALKEKNVSPDVRRFYRLYGMSRQELITPKPNCYFGVQRHPCSSADFEPVVTDLGTCFTFNSAKTTPIKNVTQQGAMFGLNVLLDAQTDDYASSQLSQGFRINVHRAGEYFESWEGISVGPGTHATLTTSRVEVPCNVCQLTGDFLFHST